MQLDYPPRSQHFEWGASWLCLRRETWGEAEHCGKCWGLLKRTPVQLWEIHDALLASQHKAQSWHRTYLFTGFLKWAWDIKELLKQRYLQWWEPMKMGPHWATGPGSNPCVPYESYCPNCTMGMTASAFRNVASRPPWLWLALGE